MRSWKKLALFWFGFAYFSVFVALTLSRSLACSSLKLALRSYTVNVSPFALVLSLRELLRARLLAALPTQLSRPPSTRLGRPGAHRARARTHTQRERERTGARSPTRTQTN